MLTLTDAARATGLIERRGLVQPLISTSEGLSELVSWRTEAHLVDDARLLRRLRVDELDFTEVRACFAGKVPTLDSSSSWLDFLARVGARSKESYPLHGYEFPFAALIAPFVEEALDELNQQVATLSSLDIRAVFGSEARSTLGKKLFDQAARVLVLEMHAARERGELYGDTSAERYESFVSQLAADRMSRLLQSYPVLARLLGMTSSDWEQQQSR
jgi:lantibiotic modifying enzyme